MCKSPVPPLPQNAQSSRGLNEKLDSLGRIRGSRGETSTLNQEGWHKIPRHSVVQDPERVSSSERVGEKVRKETTNPMSNPSAPLRQGRPRCTRAVSTVLQDNQSWLSTTVFVRRVCLLCAGSETTWNPHQPLALLGSFSSSGLEGLPRCVPGGEGNGFRLRCFSGLRFSGVSRGRSAEPT